LGGLLDLKKIAVTGGFAAGKSTVCRIFAEYGAYTVDADAITHRLLTLETAIGKKVVALLGPEIVTNNQINRKKIASIVFSNPEKLKALEAILHPAVRQEIGAEYDRVKNNPSYVLFVAEVPLLYEAGMEEDFDAVIAVMRDNMTPNLDMAPRIRRQLPPAVKAAKADYVLENNGDLQALRSSIQTLLRRIHETR
jgi:dephospho-CoA kinase